MEIKTIYNLQPLLVEYEQENVLRETIVLADIARDKLYQIVDYDVQFIKEAECNNALLSKVKEIIINKKNAQKASKVDPKILEPAIEKQKSAAISTTQVHSPYSK